MSINHQMNNIEPSPTPRAGSSTQFYIFNLFADYILPYKNGTAWTQELVYLLGLLGQSEQAARTTLSRMKQKGWFTVTRQGRRSLYQLTDRGRAIVAEGNRRIFEIPVEAWDGKWQLVVYSLPEEKRILRNQLRKKLIWFGFGKLAAGTWVAAHDWRLEIENLVDALDILPYVALFEGKPIGSLTDEQIVAKCWDLPALEREYAAFVARWQPRLAAFGTNGVETPEKRFQQRFWLTYDFQPFPRKDPNLPLVLLPPVWSGHTARQVFHHYRQYLAQGLPEFFVSLLDTAV